MLSEKNMLKQFENSRKLVQHFLYLRNNEDLSEYNGSHNNHEKEDKFESHLKSR